MFLMLLLSDCAVSKRLWEDGSYNESFKSYFIDKQTDKLILIGDNKEGDKNTNYHYLVFDDVVVNPNDNKVALKMGPTRVIGEDVKVFWIWFGIAKNDMPKEQLKPLVKNKECKEFKEIVGCRYDKVTMKRYSSSIEKSANLAEVKYFENIEYVTIREQNTLTKKVLKTFVTPFSLAADVLLLPITIPYFIYWQVKESQTPHFCEGKFCGYDKLPEHSK